jgi:hypothetical protein
MTDTAKTDVQTLNRKARIQWQRQNTSASNAEMVLLPRRIPKSENVPKEKGMNGSRKMESAGNGNASSVATGLLLSHTL